MFGNFAAKGVSPLLASVTLVYCFSLAWLDSNVILSLERQCLRLPDLRGRVMESESAALQKKSRGSF